ncbi:unnamed protein product [Diabrotica balteata]|uniref:Uncharacterized protein n=1 Tax=Diabrotica balteata TaxID=107213 RepID=A0A9P0GS44_DIABA|nr:unnamed protein product [Diabrotica balteata]
MDKGNQTETNGEIPGTVPVIDNETYEDLHSQDQNKTRKRKRNTRRWKSAQAKEKRNSGMSYTNAKGNQVASRSSKSPCNAEKCRLKCTTKVTHDDRKDIFNNYWGMCDINRQREFIVRHVTIIEPSIAIAKNLSVGVLEKDKRGKHKNHPVIPAAVLQKIKDHINSFPRIPSHYLRAQTDMEYLEGQITIAEMHRMFVQQFNDTSTQKVTYALYAHVFSNNFNIGFFKPKKDLCVKCETFKNTSPDEQGGLKIELDKHLRNKELSRKQKLLGAAEAKKGNCVCACFDLQAVMQTPHGDASLFYYKRKFQKKNR